jgi:diguanylate cyclase (GGDEF)-like protein
MAKRAPLPQPTRAPPARSTERWLGLIALSAALVLAIAAALVRAVALDSIDAARTVARSSQVAGELYQLQIALESAEGGQRGFVLMGKPSYLEPYTAARYQASLHLNALRPLTYNLPDQYHDLLLLEPLVTQRFDYLSRSIDLRQEAGLDGARRLLEADPGKKTIEPIEALVTTMQQREATRLQSAMNRQESTANEALAVMVATLTALAVLSLFFWGVLKREFLLRRRLEKGLFDSATSDDLTGAVNRPEFERLLGEEWAFRLRYATPLSMLLIDVINIDEIAAEHGMRVGDATLRDVVRRLRGRLRTTERLARYGGQQFALLLPQQLNAAAQLARQLVELVAGSPYFIGDVTSETQKTIEIMVCIGVADASDVDEQGELVQAAGDALHLAKRSGPNQVETYRLSMRRDAMTVRRVS